MSVNLRRFVNLNVSRIKRNVTNPVRDTVALIGSDLQLNDGDTATNVIFTSGAYVTDRSGIKTAYVVDGYDASTSAKTAVKRTITLTDEESDDVLYAYAKNFFKNGGAKLHAYKGTASVQTTATAANAGKLIVTAGQIVYVVPNEEIAVAITDKTLAQLDALVESYNEFDNPANPSTADSMPNMHTSAAKLFITNLTVAADAAFPADALAALQENICVKYASKGIEGTILAYLSRINVYGQNTVHDYAFTVENVDDADVINDDARIGECMQSFVNVDSDLSKAIRNIGGDLISGLDLVNYYVTIIMQQTVEEAVMSALSDKLSGAEGTAAIYNAAVTELNKYVRCGLFAPGNWEDVDWTVTFNDETYVVANANERIVQGYKLLVIPFAAMTQEQVASHACPPIYVAMTNAYGIRKVIMTGEVR